MQTSRADHLLCCALTLRESDPDSQPAVGKYASVDEALRSMTNMLLFEAKATMQADIVPPDHPYLHPVDIETAEPGIVSSKTRLDIHRRRLPVPPVDYSTHKEVRPVLAPTRDVPIDKAEKMADRESVRALKRQQTRAANDIKSEERSKETIAAREEGKRKRKEESKEEREGRLAEARARRDEKRREKEEAAARDTAEEAEQRAPDHAPPDGDPPAPEGEPEARTKVCSVSDLLEEEGVDGGANDVLPPRVKARRPKAKFYPSPVPFDRHLTALQAATPHDSLTPTLLQCAHSPGVVVLHGPPGTGKTSALVERIPAEGRVFLCAGTNVGAANLYERAIRAGHACSLLIPPSRVPPGVAVLSQNPAARIVCSTVSGRSGSFLVEEDFETVVLDEAAQCMESWFWGLLRPSVRRVVMAGDTLQLPATASEEGQRLGYDRSFMHRLVDAEYPLTFLGTQRRMHPEILRFVNERFYDGKILSEYGGTPSGAPPPYAVVRCAGRCVQVGGTSYENEGEANVALATALELQKTYGDVVILSPYQGQCRKILASKLNVAVHTVDSFQGREADAVVLSVVRDSHVGFWSDHRRLVVALTRARHCMRVVGMVDEWSSLLAELREDAVSRGLVVR